MSGHQHRNINAIRLGNDAALCARQELFLFSRRPYVNCLIAFLLAVGLGVGHPVFAQDQSLSQMRHTSWTGRDGAPQDVTALAQTPDGTLWIGSTAGLFSFDGITFTPFRSREGEPRLPSSLVNGLIATKSGELWVVGAFTGIARIANGHVAVFDRVDGEANQGLKNLNQDSQGTMWAMVGNRQLVQLGHDNVWHRTDNPLPRPGLITAFFIDSADTHWVVEDGVLYRQSKEDQHFIPTTIRSSTYVRLKEDADHTIWIVGQYFDRRSVPVPELGQHFDMRGRPLPSAMRSFSPNDILSSSDGNLWVASPTGGIIRTTHEQATSALSGQTIAALDHYSSKDGLSSSSENVLLTDSDGDVWAGGSRGIDQFVSAALVPAIGGAKEGSWSTCTNPQGEVWIASDNGELSVIRNGKRGAIYRTDGVLKLYCGRDGSVWILDPRGIASLYKGRFHRLRALPGRPPNFSRKWNYLELLELSGQELLASEATEPDVGLWKYAGHRWKRLALEDSPMPILAMISDGGGRIYLGRVDGKVSILENGSIQTLPTGTPGTGVIAAFARTSRGIFALGANGIAALRSDSVRMLSFSRPELAYTVSGLVESRNGDFWINGSRGIVRIPRAEMLAGLHDLSHKIVGEETHEGDFVGPATFWKPTPSATMDIHGRLWFSTLNGVISVDPEIVLRTSRLPQLSIRSISADGLPIDGSQTLPSTVQTLNVRYFGINLKTPRTVVYQYQLDGLDESWQDVGNRTEAIYTRLKPGTYTFRVIASNGDGRWTSSVASVRFIIPPHLYQTRWFLSLVFLFGCLLIWLAFKIRLMLAYRKISMRAEDRADERIQIARDLHDTLLQGVQGLLLTFHVAAQKASSDDPSRELMQKALTTADRLIIEGRNRVTTLRSQNLADGELLSALQGVASGLSSETPIQCDITRTGNESALNHYVVDEVFYIAREALTNAFRHSRAHNVTLELNYKKRAFSMTCRDDGKGFDVQAVNALSANGHWGLRGMLERTERIRGNIRWSSSPDKGTTVEFTIPSHRAYRRKPGFLGFSRRRLD